MPRLSALQKYIVWYGLDNFEKKCPCVISSKLPFIFIYGGLYCSTAIGIRAKDGVVLAVEKLVTSKLYEHGANKRIFNIDKHIGMCIAGLLADARAVVEIARDEAVNYRNQYRSPVPLKVCNLSFPWRDLFFSLQMWMFRAICPKRCDSRSKISSHKPSLRSYVLMRLGKSEPGSCQWEVRHVNGAYIFYTDFTDSLAPIAF